VGREAFLHAHAATRDDAPVLYGFATEPERELFWQLTSVSGVGPKVALSILGGAAPRELVAAIAAGDAKAFQAYPGVGRKTAQRIIVELREKLVDAAADREDAETSGASADEPQALARQGLIGLGYDATEAERLLDGAPGDGPEQLIAAALRRAGSEHASGRAA
jgi:holliday junction DNA helicase RuvA